MIDPRDALLIAGAITVLLVIIFYPRRGVFARWRQGNTSSKRVAMEDALKHLYDHEYKRLMGTRQSVAGALSISGDDAAQLLSRLETLGLVRPMDAGVILTDEGRSYAVRVIRVHRLWERYLADQTGVDATRWHAEAERAEHRLTTEEADALSAMMGHPRFDPHGDPIPTAAGDLPHLKGHSLAQLKPGEMGQIVHVEDEPETIYSQLVAQGLHPGVRVRMLRAGHDRIEFEAEGVENVLAPIIASNVTVVPLSTDVGEEVPQKSLSELAPGEKGRVIGLSRMCRGQQRRRLMDLGVLPGTMVTAEMQSASGDPTAYSIRGGVIALRRSQARQIFIQQEEELRDDA